MSKIYFSSLSSKDKEILDTMLTQPIGEEGESLFSLMSKLGITDQQKYLLWEAIINSMQNGARDGFSAITEDGTELSHKTPIRQDDVDISKIDPESGKKTLQILIGIIESFCDLPDEEDDTASPILKSKLFNNNLNISSPDFWNESIEKLAKAIYDLFKDNANITVLEIGQDKDITVQTLKDADAGNNFQSGKEDSHWVIPWWNIDKKNYDEVRWTDQIKSILQKGNKLQYTNNHSNWITLLMPQYGRRVEIEDLDRNFWVIAEVIDGISNWIFDTSPIPEIIKKLIDETSQLWENILYLWTQIALMNQKKDESVRIISHTETIAFNSATNPMRYGGIPVVTTKLNSNEQYEISRAGQWLNGINYVASSLSNIHWYEAQYSEQTLCFIPKTRVNVYYRNYYSADLYEKIVISKLGKVLTSDQDYTVGRERKIYELYEKLSDGAQRKILITPRSSIEPEDEIDGKMVKRFSPYIYGTNFKDNKYLYTFPFSQVDSRYSEKESIYLYGALRTIPNVQVEINKQGEPVIKTVTIDVYDAAAEIVENKFRRIGQYTFDSIIEEDGVTKILLTYKRNPTIKNEEEKELTSLKSYSIQSKNCEDISSAYYLGEVASWRMKTAVIKESKNLFKNDAILLKIGNFLPGQSTEGEGRGYLTAYFSGLVNKKTTKMTTQMRGNFTLDHNGMGTKIYFYSPDWHNYLPEKDLPDEAPDGLCFSEKPERIENGKDITEPFLARTGMVAAQQYLLKVKGLSKHPHKDLWRTPCFFTTFVGLTPWKGPEQFYWDISMACHIYKYIPSMSSMGKKETLGSNYEDEYSRHDAIQFKDAEGNSYSGKVIDDNGVELGKIITYHFINRFESYYDATGFRDSMLINSSKRGDIFDSSGWRAIKMIGAANEEEEYCRLLTIDHGNGGYAYNVHFSKDFEGIVQYYDARRAIRAGHVYDFLTDYTIGTNYQISEGRIKIQNKNGQTEYKQEEAGAIRSAEGGSSFQSRKTQSFNIKEREATETNFLIRIINGEKISPFIQNDNNNGYKPLIYEARQAPETRFGAWAGYLRVSYSYS